MNQINTSSGKLSEKKSFPFKQVFWLSFLVVSLAYAWYSFYSPPSNINWVDDCTSVEELTSNSEKNTILFFTGKWCSPCRIMNREVFSDQEVEEIINSQFLPVKIDIDNTITKDIATHYRVRTTPTTIIINPKGEVLYLYAGEINKNDFLEVLRNF